MLLVTVVTIISALGVAVPAAASPTSIKVVPNAIKFGTKVVGTDYFDSVEIKNASNDPLQFSSKAGCRMTSGSACSPDRPAPR